MKARNFRETKGVAYTRTKFIHGAPLPKITKFTTGDPNRKFDYKFTLVADRRLQIRHNALEAARIAVNRELQVKLGENFFMRVKPLPHVVLRENKMIFGAHADRLQDGMRKSFGKPVGRAARVEPGQVLVEAFVNEDGIDTAKLAMKRGEDKLPTTCKIVMEKITKPEEKVNEVAS